MAHAKFICVLYIEVFLKVGVLRLLSGNVLLNDSIDLPYFEKKIQKKKSGRQIEKINGSRAGIAISIYTHARFGV